MSKASRAYRAPSVRSYSADDLAELLGPAQTQYVQETLSIEQCLQNSSLGDSTQDDFSFSNPRADNPVTIDVDAIETIGFGPLDPKLAVYPPGIGPIAGQEYQSAGECNGPGDACIELDTVACSAAGLPPTACPELTVTLDAAGDWTVSVAPEAPAGLQQSEGCYVLTITGLGISNLTQTGDDTTVTFFRVLSN